MATDVHKELLNASAADKIAPLDPLRADERVSRLAEWNAAGDIAMVIAALSDLSPTVEQAARFNRFEACAAVRDLGMLLCSLRRHGIEPAAAVPAVVQPLLVMGRTCEMVPRDTVYHYGPWNPAGDRERCFTHDPNEKGLIHCVRSAAPGVELAIAALAEVDACTPDTPAFTEGCRRAARCVMAMVTSINYARRHVDVRFFARVLRPYFEPVTIDGTSYMGPAAAHLPLCVVDHLTWGSDCADPTYQLFQEDAARYTVPAWRELCASTAGSPSLVTRVASELDRRGITDPALFRAAAAVYAILRVLLAFRGRHKVLADKAYDPNVRLYAVGSGGFSTDVVARILEVTRERAFELKRAVKRRHVSLHPPSSISGLLAGRGAGR
jgi:hypothetical protein